MEDRGTGLPTFPASLVSASSSLPRDHATRHVIFDCRGQPEKVVSPIRTVTGLSSRLGRHTTAESLTSRRRPGSKSPSPPLISKTRSPILPKSQTPNNKHLQQPSNPKNVRPNYPHRPTRNLVLKPNIRHPPGPRNPKNKGPLPRLAGMHDRGPVSPGRDRDREVRQDHGPDVREERAR
jgi:hypothetical protein